LEGLQERTEQVYLRAEYASNPTAQCLLFFIMSLVATTSTSLICSPAAFSALRSPTCVKHHRWNTKQIKRRPGGEGDDSQLDGIEDITKGMFQIAQLQ